MGPREATLRLWCNMVQLCMHSTTLHPFCRKRRIAGSVLCFITTTCVCVFLCVSAHLDAKKAGDLSTLFDVGGIVGMWSCYLNFHPAPTYVQYLLTWMDCMNSRVTIMTHCVSVCCVLTIHFSVNTLLVWHSNLSLSTHYAVCSTSSLTS